MNQESSVTEILRITSPGARVIVIISLLVDGVLVFSNLGAVISPLPSIVALLLVAGGAALVTLPAPEPMPVNRAIVLLAQVGVSTFLVSWNLPPGERFGYAAWHLGANLLILVILGLRGRTGLAWLGFALILGITLLWTATVGERTLGLISLMPNQAGTLVVGTLFAVGLRRTSRTITALHAQQAALASAESATRAAALERARQAANLNLVARPALERIASAEEYTDAERDAWIRLEASVRDRLRAPSLNSSALTTAANNARERGVEVTLLDDSAGGLESAAEREAVTSAIIGQLSTMKTGRLIGRVLPRGRGKLATILVDNGESTKRTDVE